jgi:hypothetical protein
VRLHPENETQSATYILRKRRNNLTWALGLSESGPFFGAALFLSPFCRLRPRSSG